MLGGKKPFEQAYQQQDVLDIAEPAEHTWIDIGMAHVHHAMEYG